MTGVTLSSNQRRFLRAEAHRLEPSVRVGREGVTPGVLAAIRQALDARELIKVRFVALKEAKEIVLPEIAGRTDSACVGTIGHIAIFYRPHPDPERRALRLPPPRAADRPSPTGVQ